MSEWVSWVIPGIKLSLGLGAFGVGSIALLLYLFQARILYYPTMPPEAKTMYLDPAQFGLDGVLEEVFFHAEDGVKLQAYVVLHNNSTEVPTVLFFHGNAGNLSFRLDNVAKLFRDVGVNVVILSYRGYGKSDESEFPSQAGLRKDARAALAYCTTGDLSTRIDPASIVLFGRSLGGAVAIDLAASAGDGDGGGDDDGCVVALVVENTFTSIGDMAQTLFTPHFALVEGLISNPWRSIDAMEGVHIPTLLLSGARDELVPPRMMSALHRTCPAVYKHMEVFPQGMHMNTHAMEGYWDVWRTFMRKHVGECTPITSSSSS